jgi:hypothetical protein
LDRDVAQQVQRVGRKSGLGRREFDRAVALPPRVVEPAQHQLGSSQPKVPMYPVAA